MRNVFYIIICVLLCLNASGQKVGQSIRLDNPVAGSSDESLEICIDLTASELNMTSDEMVILEFAIEDGTRRLVLPVVAYCGNQRYLYEQRRTLLSDDLTPLSFPYYVYQGIKHIDKYELPYRLTVPYHGWMEYADLTWCEYFHSCTGEIITNSGILVAVTSTKPQPWAPDASLFASLVNFLQPEIEEVKARASMIELHIGFPVNDTRVRYDFGSNRVELARADSLISMLRDNSLIDIRSVGICGYASPEGTYSYNKRLAYGRSESFKRYLAMTYPDNTHICNAFTTCEPEDWAGFGCLVESMDIPSKHDILSIVNDPEIDPDVKDRILRNIPWWRENRSFIYNTLFAGLRRIELKVDYAVEQLSDDQARELLYTDPNMLSLDEMYRVARYFEPGSSEYLEVYEIAARMFPDDFIANNNAAAALLQHGNGKDAYHYLQKMGMREESYINLGAYYYVMGDLGLAVEYFNKAKQAGYEQGELNLQKLR